MSHQDIFVLFWFEGPGLLGAKLNFVLCNFKEVLNSTDEADQIVEESYELYAIIV